jgi:dihydroorotase
MSATLFKNATIVDPTSEHHLKKRDVLVEKGIIKKIANTISEPKAKEIRLKNLHISQGWFDSSVCFGEPGYEDRETISNGLRTTASSGFTDIALNALALPVVDSKSGIQYIKGKSAGNAVSVHPVGALSMQAKGKDLAELYDMKSEGAVAFYDYQLPIENANLLKIALQYAQNFKGLVQSFPLDPSISRNGLVNEEVNSTKLGLKGIPALSEELQITRDLYILEYTGGSLHIPTISTRKSVQLIKDAKKKGLDVTCSVSINNLCFTDDELDGFDTNFKVLPPLRTLKDVKALLKGLKEGTIDGVTSNHNPRTIEDKKTEFDHAAFGSIGLESCFGALNQATDLETAIKALSGLKNRFGIETHSISQGSKASLTLFNPDGATLFSKDHITSTSKNAAMLGRTLKGSVYGIVNNAKVVLND